MRNTNQYSFSILICNYNYAQYITDAIDSCLSQDYPKDLFEIIVVDDGSTDNSREVLEKYKNNKQVKVIYQENQGQTSAFNTAFRDSSKDLICLLDSDDYFLPNKLQTISLELTKYKNLNDYLFLCHNLQILHKEKYLSKSWFDEMGIHTVNELNIEMATGSFPFAVTSGHIYSRKLFEKIILIIPLSWKISVDIILGHLAFLYTGKIYYIHNNLSIYRIHENNAISQLNTKGIYSTKNNLKPYWTKLIDFMFTLLDEIDFNKKERGIRMTYIKALEKQLNISASFHNFTEAKITYILLNNTNANKFIEEQNHSNYEVIHLNNLSLTSIAEAYFRSNGDYIVFVNENTLLDKHFTERHLYAHQYKAICTITSSDIRIVNNNNSLIFSGLFGKQLWKSDFEYTPPFKSSANPIMPSLLQASCLRKTKMMNLFFSQCLNTNSPYLDSIYDWLIITYASMIGGHLKINECLSSVILTDSVDGLQFSSDLNNKLLLKQINPKEVCYFFLQIINNNSAIFQAYCNKMGINSLRDWLKRNLGLTNIL